MAQSGSIRAGKGGRHRSSDKAGRKRLLPKKSLGQHFLIDRGIVLQILRLARFQSSDPVLEIGPGRGSLTLPLARRVRRVVAVEKDRNLACSLERKLSRSGINNVTVVNQDILKWDFQDIDSAYPSKVFVIGNLPYNISTPLLEKLIQNRQRLTRAVLMFQSEVGRRITAGTGGKSYGAMSVLIRYHAKTTALLDVPKEAFYPRPKVNSMVVDLDFEKPYPGGSAINERSFRQVVRGAFAHRRKTLINSLLGGPVSFTREVLLNALKHCEIDPQKRAEALDMKEFLCLTKVLSLTNRAGSDS